MSAKEWIKSVRLTVCIEEELPNNQERPKYHREATDEYGAITYHIYADDPRVITAYIQYSPYNLHPVGKMEQKGN